MEIPRSCEKTYFPFSFGRMVFTLEQEHRQLLSKKWDEIHTNEPLQNYLISILIRKYVENQVWVNGLLIKWRHEMRFVGINCYKIRRRLMGMNNYKVGMRLKVMDSYKLMMRLMVLDSNKIINKLNLLMQLPWMMWLKQKPKFRLFFSIGIQL